MNPNGCRRSAASRFPSRWCRSGSPRHGARSKLRPPPQVVAGRCCFDAARRATLSSRMAGTGLWTMHLGASPIRERWPRRSTASPGWSSMVCLSGSLTPRCWQARTACESSNGIRPPNKGGVPMLRYSMAGVARAAITGLVISAVTSLAQQRPSPAALAAANELVTIKGAKTLYEPLIVGVVEKAKGMFLQTNPMLGKDLNDVAANLRNEFAPRATEVMNATARLYADRFTEQELKDTVAFYKSALGRKLLSTEPAIADESVRAAAHWAEKLSEEIMSRMRAEMKKRGHEI